MPSDADFADNATARFKEWLRITLGESDMVDNLNHVEKCLGKSIDDYFVKDFWKDHKKMYQNRPIYWLFASKKGAFQCIAYMQDRKSTRLNSSHANISYAVFCLKKKQSQTHQVTRRYH